MREYFKSSLVLAHGSSSTRILRMSEMEDRWLSVDEIGKYLGVSSDTVYRWIDKHAMPAHRMGRLWKFKKDEVDEWVKAGGAADKSRQDQAE
jgi:excisionase family DNA binding protein